MVLPKILVLTMVMAMQGQGETPTSMAQLASAATALGLEQIVVRSSQDSDVLYAHAQYPSLLLQPQPPDCQGVMKDISHHLTKIGGEIERRGASQLHPRATDDGNEDDAAHH